MKREVKNYMIIFLLILCLGGCAPEVDYGMYNFAGVQWLRNTECDVESLCFFPNGEFRYSCACGNSVNDADVVESYQYDDASKMFLLKCSEEVEGMITEIKLVSCDGERLELDFGGDIRIFYKEGIEKHETEEISVGFDVDLTKISPMIRENVESDVVVAAKLVIESFLKYENSVEIEVSGNSQRFMNDMAYVIHCTCPLFGAFTDFSEVSSYDEETGTVSWNFFIEQEEFNQKKETFYNVIETYMSNVTASDTEAMRAILLYYALIDDLEYDYNLLGEHFEKLSKEEANLESSPYYVLVEKSGICTNIAQAYMFLCTQADIVCGTVLHMGGSGMHMWNIVQMDGKYYYSDPTWDANTSLKYFGMTADDRASWAGEYAKEEGSMLSVIVPEKYEVSDSRFEVLREKLPVEISALKVDKSLQTITFIGYEYEYVFDCK